MFLCLKQGGEIWSNSTSWRVACFQFRKTSVHSFKSTLVRGSAFQQTVVNCFPSSRPRETSGRLHNDISRCRQLKTQPWTWHPAGLSLAVSFLSASYGLKMAAAYVEGDTGQRKKTETQAGGYAKPLSSRTIDKTNIGWKGKPDSAISARLFALITAWVLPRPFFLGIW